MRAGRLLTGCCRESPLGSGRAQPWRREIASANSCSPWLETESSFGRPRSVARCRRRSESASISLPRSRRGRGRGPRVGDGSSWLHLSLRGRKAQAGRAGRTGLTPASDVVRFAARPRHGGREQSGARSRPAGASLDIGKQRSPLKRRLLCRLRRSHYTADAPSGAHPFNRDAPLSCCGVDADAPSMSGWRLSLPGPRQSASPRRPGSDRRQPRQPRPRAAQFARSSVDHATPSPRVRLRRYMHDPLSPLPVPPRSDVLARQGLAWGQSAQAPTAPLTRCARPTVGTVRRESSATHRRATWTRSRRSAREPSNGASRSASASAPSRTKSTPAAGRVIVQCVDEIDEMQRWLESRE